LSAIANAAGQRGKSSTGRVMLSAQVSDWGFANFPKNFSDFFGGYECAT
jgi:hypothetical protein